MLTQWLQSLQLLNNSYCAQGITGNRLGHSPRPNILTFGNILKYLPRQIIGTQIVNFFFSHQIINYLLSFYNFIISYNQKSNKHDALSNPLAHITFCNVLSTFVSRESRTNLYQTIATRFISRSSKQYIQILGFSTRFKSSTRLCPNCALSVRSESGLVDHLSLNCAHYNCGL